MSHIRSVDWLAQHLHDPQTVIVDCRFDLSRPSAGREAYQEGHIPGAQYVDLEQDLSGPAGEHGGRHPLPDLGAFAIRLGQMGIDHSVQVVAYDDQGGAMASRFWWLLRFLGHHQVAILDGGLTAWKKQGHTLTKDVLAIQERSFTPQVQTHMLICMEDVKDRIGQRGTVLLDSREPKRYLGLEEPIDPVAGHIPTALNAFWKEGLREDGMWKTAEEQKQRFQKLKPEDEIIVYCGSGVTACPNVLALTEAGYQRVKLYSGSWSDWISYSDNPIATGEE